MTATPVQRIEAAIVRLEEMRNAEAIRGHLLFTYYAGVNPSPFDALTLTLHATIDAQLAILNRFSEYPNRELEEPVMALADAIISGGTE